ncbi:MAG TPA: DUF2283 domain-containing protein [Roseomonas sp.]|nr:DUF2283 domain-containing protein [Roseomonas sp.]
MKAVATYDPEADAIGIYFKPEDAEYDGSEGVAPGVTPGFDTQGRVIGVEILGVRNIPAGRVLPLPTPRKPAAAK